MLATSFADRVVVGFEESSFAINSQISLGTFRLNFLISGESASANKRPPTRK
jgi:hypothetical protein